MRPTLLLLLCALAACSRTEPASDRSVSTDSTRAAAPPPAAPAPAPPSPATSGKTIDSALFAAAVRKNFPAEIIRRTRTKGALGMVRVEPPAGSPDYFATDDRINRILAVESMTLFRDLPDLEAVQIIVAIDRSQNQMEVTRAEAEKFYRMKFRPMSEEEWRLHFVDLFDIPGSRASFAKAFTGVRTPME